MQKTKLIFQTLAVLEAWGGQGDYEWGYMLKNFIW